MVIQLIPNKMQWKILKHYYTYRNFKVWWRFFYQNPTQYCTQFIERLYYGMCIFIILWMLIINLQLIYLYYNFWYFYCSFIFLTLILLKIIQFAHELFIYYTPPTTYIIHILETQPILLTFFERQQIIKSIHQCQNLNWPLILKNPNNFSDAEIQFLLMLDKFYWNPFVSAYVRGIKILDLEIFMVLKRNRIVRDLPTRKLICEFAYCIPPSLLFTLLYATVYFSLEERLSILDKIQTPYYTYLFKRFWKFIYSKSKNCYVDESQHNNFFYDKNYVDKFFKTPRNFFNFIWFLKYDYKIYCHKFFIFMEFHILDICGILVYLLYDNYLPHMLFYRLYAASWMLIIIQRILNHFNNFLYTYPENDITEYLYWIFLHYPDYLTKIEKNKFLFFSNEIHLSQWKYACYKQNGFSRYQYNYVLKFDDIFELIKISFGVQKLTLNEFYIYLRNPATPIPIQGCELLLYMRYHIDYYTWRSVFIKLDSYEEKNLYRVLNSCFNVYKIFFLFYKFRQTIKQVLNFLNTSVKNPELTHILLICAFIAGNYIF